MQINQRFKRLRALRFYKYKHKRRRKIIVSKKLKSELLSRRRGRETELDIKSCDMDYMSDFRRQSSSDKSARCRLLLIALLVLCPPFTENQVHSFCPFKCLCNDQSLSANCTQVPSISIVPMTLNPSLRSLTLNHLPVIELSNSLSIYRQLEYLNLNWNQLRQIKYENFNFKSAPNSMILHHHRHYHHSSPSSSGSGNTNPGATISPPLGSLFNSRQEQLAKHFKSTIEGDAHPEFYGDPSDEIRFHLTELHLANNRIEQLGSIQETDLQELDGLDESSSELGGFFRKRLKSIELERLSPFLSLTRLNFLDLSGNRLTRLHQHVFLGLVRLRRLDLSRNGLEFLSEFAFVGLIELRELKLNQNHLTHQLPQLARSICRAPMVELTQLGLSDNHQPPASMNLDTRYKSFEDSLTILPARMFVCSPKLVTLRLDSIRLRHIQVNAFENLHQLAVLNLSRNPLEQVPSESLSSTNLGSSLQHLDLSDTLIEYVNARSFGSLQALQKLSMNSMSRMVSFDLASLNFRNSLNGLQALDSFDQSSQAKTVTSLEDRASESSEFKLALKRFLPNHLFSSLLPSDTWLTSRDRRDSSLGSKSHSKNLMSNGEVKASDLLSTDGTQSSIGSSSFINHYGLQFINDQLIELELRHNPRLQSFHSSLSNMQRRRGQQEHQQPNEVLSSAEADDTNNVKRLGRKVEPQIEGGVRVRLTKLRSLDLFGARELLELPLDSMIDLTALSEPLRLDLSHAGRLNCSSCALSWLLDVARQQRLSQASSVPSSRLANGLWSPAPLLLSQIEARQSWGSLSEPARVELENLNLIGCSHPSDMALIQLLDLEANSDEQHQINCPKIGVVNFMGSNETSVGLEPPDPVELAGRGVLRSAAAGRQPSRIQPNVGTSELANEASTGSMVLAILMLLLLVAFSIKILISLISRWNEKRHEKRMSDVRQTFKWLPIDKTASKGQVMKESASFSMLNGSQISTSICQKFASPTATTTAATTTNSSSSNSNCNQVIQDALNVSSQLGYFHGVESNVDESEPDKSHAKGKSSDKLVCYRSGPHQSTGMTPSVNRLANLDRGGAEEYYPVVVGSGNCLTLTRATNSSGGLILRTLLASERQHSCSTKSSSRGSKKGEILGRRQETAGRWEGNLFSRLAGRLSGARRQGNFFMTRRGSNGRSNIDDWHWSSGDECRRIEADQQAPALMNNLLEVSCGSELLEDGAMILSRPLESFHKAPMNQTITLSGSQLDQQQRERISFCNTSRNGSKVGQQEEAILFGNSRSIAKQQLFPIKNPVSENTKLRSPGGSSSLLSSSSVSSFSCEQNSEPGGGHIYVTLDRPIKQRRQQSGWIVNGTSTPMGSRDGQPMQTLRASEGNSNGFGAKGAQNGLAQAEQSQFEPISSSSNHARTGIESFEQNYDNLGAQKWLKSPIEQHRQNNKSFEWSQPSQPANQSHHRGRETTTTTTTNNFDHVGAGSKIAQKAPRGSDDRRLSISMRNQMDAKLSSSPICDIGSGGTEIPYFIPSASDGSSFCLYSNEGASKIVTPVVIGASSSSLEPSVSTKICLPNGGIKLSLKPQSFMGGDLYSSGQAIRYQQAHKTKDSDETFDSPLARVRGDLLDCGASILTSDEQSIRMNGSVTERKVTMRKYDDDANHDQDHGHNENQFDADQNPNATHHDSCDNSLNSASAYLLKDNQTNRHEQASNTGIEKKSKNYVINGGFAESNRKIVGGILFNNTDVMESGTKSRMASEFPSGTKTSRSNPNSSVHRGQQLLCYNENVETKNIPTDATEYSAQFILPTSLESGKVLEKKKENNIRGKHNIYTNSNNNCDSTISTEEHLTSVTLDTSKPEFGSKQATNEITTNTHKSNTSLTGSRDATIGQQANEIYSSQYYYCKPK